MANRGWIATAGAVCQGRCWPTDSPSSTYSCSSGPAADESASGRRAFDPRQTASATAAFRASVGPVAKDRLRIRAPCARESLIPCATSSANGALPVSTWTARIWAKEKQGQQKVETGDDALEDDAAARARRGQDSAQEAADSPGCCLARRAAIAAAESLLARYTGRRQPLPLAPRLSPGSVFQLRCFFAPRSPGLPSPRP